jgi:hypothetical protein
MKDIVDSLYFADGNHSIFSQLIDLLFLKENMDTLFFTYDFIIARFCDFGSNYTKKTSKVVIACPNEGTTLQELSFAECEKIETIFVSHKVDEIQKSVFLACKKLTKVYLPDKITRLEHAVFAKCSSLKTIKLPDSVTFIGSSCFAECSSLEEIVIPPNVREISQAAFGRCNALRCVTIPARFKDKHEEILKIVFTNIVDISKIKFIYQ